MRMSTTFDVHVSPDRVAGYLADPRHLIAANHKGPVLERSDGPVATGSWFVLGFDQLRMRVDYVLYEPRLIRAKVEFSGRGSGKLSAVHGFRLTPLAAGEATRVEADVDGTGGWLGWEPLMRAGQRLRWRQLRKQIERSV
jgi:Polyketide cyclase / dehydrase and lipid transport